MLHNERTVRSNPAIVPILIWDNMLLKVVAHTRASALQIKLNLGMIVRRHDNKPPVEVQHPQIPSKLPGYRRQRKVCDGRYLCWKAYDALTRHCVAQETYDVTAIL